MKLVSQPMVNVVHNLEKLAESRADHIQKFKVTHKTVHILLTLPGDIKFGYLRDNMTKALEPLLQKSPTIQIEAVGNTNQLCEQIGRATKPDEALVQVNINIYGPLDQRGEVGSILSRHKLWLQRPDDYRAQFPYSQESNPHMITFPELQGQVIEEEVRKELSTASKPRAEKQRLEKLIQEIQHSTRDRESGLENEDQKLETELLGWVNPKRYEQELATTNNHFMLDTSNALYHLCCSASLATYPSSSVCGERPPKMAKTCEYFTNNPSHHQLH